MERSLEYWNKPQTSKQREAARLLCHGGDTMRMTIVSNNKAILHYTALHKLVGQDPMASPGGRVRTSFLVTGTMASKCCHTKPRWSLIGFANSFTTTTRRSNHFVKKSDLARILPFYNFFFFLFFSLLSQFQRLIKLGLRVVAHISSVYKFLSRVNFRNIGIKFTVAS